MAEMDRALKLDGDKLRALTGEDHGPFKLPETRFVICDECSGSGEPFNGTTIVCQGEVNHLPVMGYSAEHLSCAPTATRSSLKSRRSSSKPSTKREA